MALAIKDMLKGEVSDSYPQKHIKSNFTTINHEVQEESYTVSKKELDKAPSSVVLSDEVKDSSKMVTIQSHATSKNDKAPLTPSKKKQISIEKKPVEKIKPKEDKSPSRIKAQSPKESSKAPKPQEPHQKLTDGSKQMVSSKEKLNLQSPKEVKEKRSSLQQSPISHNIEEPKFSFQIGTEVINESFIEEKDSPLLSPKLQEPQQIKDTKEVWV